jgi:mRNA interferase YafQ
MRTISRSGRFRRDYKRLKAAPFGAEVEVELREALAVLAADKPLPERFRDHALVGAWKGCRDCHIRPDLVLIYRKPNDATLELVRLGSHSELGL